MSVRTVNGAGTETQTADRPEGNVPAALRRMDAQIDHLSERVGELVDILRPVTLPPEPIEREPFIAYDPDKSSALYKEICGMIDRIEALTRIVYGLCEHVDL